MNKKPAHLTQSEEVSRVFCEAQAVASEYRASYVGIRHVLVGLLEIKECFAYHLVEEYFRRHGIECRMELLKQQVETSFALQRDRSNPGPKPTEFSALLRRAIDASKELASKRCLESFGTDHLLLCLLADRGSGTRGFLGGLEIDYSEIEAWVYSTDWY